MNFLKNLLRPPVYDDYAKQRIVNFQNTMLWVFIAVTVLGISSSFIYSTNVTTPSLKLMWENLLLYVIALVLQRHNRIAQASWVLLSNLFVTAISLGMIFPDSFAAPVVLTLTISLSGFLLYYWGVAVVTGVSIIALYMLQLVTNPQIDLARLLVELELIGCEGMLVAVASYTLKKSDREITKGRNALLETNQKLQTIINHFPGLVFWKDRHSVYQGCNQAFLEVNKLNNPNAIIGRTDYDLPFSRDGADSYRAIDKQVIDAGAPKTGNITRQLQTDGSVRWYENSKVPLLGGDGNVTGVLGVLVDITVRKQATDALRENEAKFSTVFQFSPVALVITSKDSIILDANESLLQLVGCKRSELVGQHVDVLDLLLDREKRAYIQQLIAAHGRIENYEFEFRDKVGELGYGMLSTTLITINGEPCFLSQITIITERKRAEEIFARRAADLATVAAISATISTTLDPDRLLQEVSDITKERFNLYHVHIYLVKDNTLFLAAGAGDIGQKLAAEQHAIPLDAKKSLVARAARECIAVVANDVQDEADFLSNLLLPDTRSEMAVPLIVGENMLGVLDVQSNKMGHFTQEDIDIETTLARQIAIALQNARQYTEIEQMEISLSASETRLSETMSLAKIGGWEFDIQTRTFTFSDHFYAIYHTTAEQQGGYHVSADEYFRRFIHPDDMAFVLKKAEENLNSSEQRYTSQMEHRVLFSDGGVGFMLVERNIERDENGAIIRYYGSNQDITERKKIETDLRLKQAHLSTAATMARLGYWEYDTEKDIFTFDDHFYAIYHTTAAEQGGDQMPSAEYAQRFVHPEDALSVGNWITQTLSFTEKFSTNSLVHRIIYADGGEGYISVRYIVKRDAEGLIKHTYGVNQDITEIVKNKNNLIEMNQKLEAALMHEKTMRLQLIQSERLSLVGQLMASISHELNNPLQAIQNSLFLLKDERRISAQGQRQMGIVLSAAERMSILLEQVRASYRPTRMEDFQSIQLNTLIEDVSDLIATYMRHREISLEFAADPELPMISGIPDQLRQVALNLFMNAAEAMPSGGNITVCTRFLSEQDKALFSVTDTGFGIAPELIPQIFEPFVTGKETGTGLGLTITHDIISQHGGTIQAENNPQGGATFKIILPLMKTS